MVRSQNERIGIESRPQLLCDLITQQITEVVGACGLTAARIDALELDQSPGKFNRIHQYTASRVIG